VTADRHQSRHHRRVVNETSHGRVNFPPVSESNRGVNREYGADQRGPYQPNQYGNGILPFTILRRLDCILEPTKDEVLAKVQEDTVQEDRPRCCAQVKIQAAFLQQHISRWTFASLVSDPKMVALAEVIEKINDLFSGDHPDSGVRNVVTHIKDRLEESDTLQQQAQNNTLAQFSASPDLQNEFLSAVIGAMGTSEDPVCADSQQPRPVAKAARRACSDCLQGHEGGGVGGRLHDLRHAFAVLQLSAGTHFMQVSTWWLGHSTFTLTLDVYGDYIAGGRRRAQQSARATRPGETGRATDQRTEFVWEEGELERSAIQKFPHALFKIVGSVALAQHLHRNLVSRDPVQQRSKQQ
jgi:hypothetical protein